MRLPFGKYAGAELQHIIDTDIEYLLWITTNPVWGKKHDSIIQQIREIIAPHIDKHNQLQEKINSACKIHLQEVSKMLKSACMKKTFKTGNNISYWTKSIIDNLDQGKLLSERAMNIVVDMCGKASGRRNSRSYLEAANKAQSAFDKAIRSKLNILDGTHR